MLPQGRSRGGGQEDRWLLISQAPTPDLQLLCSFYLDPPCFLCSGDYPFAYLPISRCG